MHVKANRGRLIFFILTTLVILLSAKFTWPDGDDGRYAVWAISIARGEGITNIHLPEPTPEVIVPPGLSIALAPIAALSGENLKAMILFSPLCLIALAWVMMMFLQRDSGFGIRDARCPPEADPPLAGEIRDTRYEIRDSGNGMRDSGYEIRAPHIPDPGSRITPTVYGLKSTVYSLSILALWPVFIISSAWRVHTEILFMLLTFSAFALWPQRDERNWKIILPGLLTGAAFATRTVGLALLPAGILALLVRRQWIKALLFTAAFFAMNAPLMWRAYESTGSLMPYSQYAGESNVGIIDKLHEMYAFASHYVFYGLPDLMFYRLFSADGLLSQLGLGVMSIPSAALIGMLIVAGFLSRIFKFQVTDLFFGAYIVMISSFNQADYAARGELLFQDRYVIPVIPIAAIYLARSFELLARIPFRPASRLMRLALPALALYVMITTVGAGISRARQEFNVRGLSPMDPARYAVSENENDRAWGSYFAGAQWLKANASPGAVVFCRKPYEMFLASGHQSDRYIEHGTGTNLIAALLQHQARGAYLIEDAFPADTAFGRERIAIIEPLLSKYPQSFELVFETANPPARVWRMVNRL